MAGRITDVRIVTAPLPDDPAPTYPTDQEIRSFYEDGLIVLRSVFDPREVRRMAAGFQRLGCEAAKLTLQGLDGAVDHRGASFVLDQRAIRRVVWCSAADPVLDRFGEDRRLTELAAALLGVPDMDHLISQAHFKLPGDGVAFPFHQDSAHRRYGTDEWTDVTGRGSYVQTLVALDEMTDDNGPMLWIPRSCQAGHLPPTPGRRVLPADLVDESAARALNMQPGDVAAFGPYTIHGSRPNTSQGPRRVFINGFAAAGANHRRYPGFAAGAGRRVSAAR